ncbi:dual specificity protein phosphatase family protein [Streptomonospora sp. S1-112]|uniref:Dual specificity protein phosphatase family protein n=1 Tax=Streptomonospora mangrovi TaxID=2883123 RepID=A0A9X3NH97_9ACTN|nr:dual specificity protein phosphatase family protein [Streptomonospora mangrovi]MDA0563447.1 dual specificity protein phosphatase family protein [Streptomonospora mangrovi]
MPSDALSVPSGDSAAYTPSHPPVPSFPPSSWHQDDPRHDRAAGAWVGAGAAGCLVGAPAALVTELVDASAADAAAAGPGPAAGAATDSGAARLAGLIRAAITRLDAPADLGTALADPRDRAFARAVREACAQGRPPSPDSAAPVPGDPRGAALRAVAETPVPDLDLRAAAFPCRHFVDAVWRAAALGGDVAALYAGALAGARWGASGVPLEAQRRLADIVAPHDLVVRGVVMARGSDPALWPENSGYQTGESKSIYLPFHTPHPHDPGVILGNLTYLRSRPDVDAVVTLNRIGPGDAHTGLPARDRVEVWLADHPGANPNLPFVLEEAAAAVAALRAEGKRVLLHCAAGQSRTPAVAALYAVRGRGADVREALPRVIRAVEGHLNNPELSATVAALCGVHLDDVAAELFPEGLPPRRHHRA